MVHSITVHAESLKGDPMNTVNFKTENAVFQFDLKKVKKCLETLATECGVEEANTILKRIAIPRDEPKLIQVKHNYFGHIALELTGAGKGSVTCKSCDKTYKATQLKPITVGHGKSPFDVNPGTKGGVKGLFTKKRKMPLFGGKGYECPTGHELISMITWRT
jgi:hypothetical protein